MPKEVESSQTDLNIRRLVEAIRNRHSVRLIYLYLEYWSLENLGTMLLLDPDRALINTDSGGHLLSASTTNDVGSPDTRLGSFFVYYFSLCLLYRPILYLPDHLSFLLVG